jgi:APA family basic amino acid/polyamine antiporter
VRERTSGDDPQTERIEYRRGRRPGDVYLRRRRIRTAGLYRVLGVAGLFSSAYGNVGSSIYYALGVTAAFALGLTPLAFVISGFFFLCTALSYAEGTTAMPYAGGSSAFARRAFNELAGFVAGWAQVLNFIVTISISAFAVPNYLSVFIPALKTWPANSLIGILVIAALAWINIIGVKESSRVNVILALVDLSTQMLLVLLGLLILLSPETLLDNIHFGVAPTWEQLVLGISISMIAYTGIETVSNLAEETKNPSKNVPRSVLMTFGAVIVMYTLIPLVGLSALPVEQAADGQYTTELAGEFIQDPVLGIVKQFSALPDALRAILESWVGILAATILIVATNAGMLGLSRLAYSLGRHRQLPPIVSRLHPRRRTPANAIAIFAVVSALLLVPGEVKELASLYSFGAMLSFTFAHVSIIAMRVREPEMERPFRVPLGIRVRGRSIPLPSLIGALATGITWIIVVVDQDLTRAIGFGWLIAGLLLYFLYDRWKRRARDVAEDSTDGVS